MPVNRNALIRYRTIDNCLRNRRRKWSLQDLLTACSDALYEYEGIEKELSVRTLRLDLQAMRSDKLGYNAPIIVTENKYYSYEDPSYSITKIPLTHEDIQVLKNVSLLLQQFKGFQHFQEAGEMINRLEAKIRSEEENKPSVIDFEKNNLLKGIDWLDQLYHSILDKTTLEIEYQSFKARTSSPIVFFPYLLKEYRNRWFVLGMHKKTKELMTLALDRIQGIQLLPAEKFLENKNFVPSDYYKDIVGVTKNFADKPTEIQFLVNFDNAPYLRTKPIHSSQKEIGKQKEGILFQIEVIPNFELEREFLSYGEALKLIAPNSLVRIFKRHAKKIHALYFPGYSENQ